MMMPMVIALMGLFRGITMIRSPSVIEACFPFLMILNPAFSNALIALLYETPGNLGTAKSRWQSLRISISCLYIVLQSPTDRSGSHLLCFRGPLPLCRPENNSQEDLDTKSRNLLQTSLISQYTSQLKYNKIHVYCQSHFRIADSASLSTLWRAPLCEGIFCPKLIAVGGALTMASKLKKIQPLL